MRRGFQRFIGVDLGGGKGKTTAVARLRLGEKADGAAGPGLEVIVEDLGTHGPWYDEQLIEYVLRHADGAVLAIDAPLTLTACVRCVLPTCPGIGRCQVPTVAWFRERAVAAGDSGNDRRKPRYTPYTQRATEVVLHEDFGITPRETLGQGMGPLTARMAYLRRALSSTYTLNENLLEVYPKATLTQLFPDSTCAAAAQATAAGQGQGQTSNTGTGSAAAADRHRILYKDGNGHTVALDGAAEPLSGPQSQVARQYKRSGHAVQIRARVLDDLPGLRFGPGQWREFAVQNDHQFDALICAYSAFLWARDGWDLPADSHEVFAEDGWIWFPPGPLPRKTG